MWRVISNRWLRSPNRRRFPLPFDVREDLLLGRPQPVPASTPGCSHGIKEQRLGRIPSGERGRPPHPYVTLKANELLSARIVRASSTILKGISSVPQSAE